MTILKATSRFVRWGWLLFLPFFGCSRSLLRVLHTKFIPYCAGLLLCLPIIASSANITLNSSTETATAGNFQLNWQAEQFTAEFVLQESFDENFTSAKILYDGADMATVISGKPDNVYFYRVSEKNNPANISNTVKVTVAHHSLYNAFTFFAVGAIVFIATLFLIFHGNRQGS